MKRIGRVSSRTLLTGLLCVAILLLGAPRAIAHAALVSTTPSANGDASTTLDSVVLRFSEAVDPVQGGLSVVDGDGKAVHEGRVDRVGGDRETLRVALGRLAPGAYLASWRVVSTDGHPIRGAFTFRVGRVGDQSTLGRLMQRMLTENTTAPAVGFAAALARFLTYGALVAVLGILLFTAMVDREAARSGVVRRIFRGASTIGAGSAIAATLLNGPYVSGGSLRDALRGNLLAESLGTSTGRALAARSVAFVLLAVIASRPDGRRTRHAITFVVMLIAINQVFIGHGAVGRQPVLSGMATLLHVVAASGWLGGLLIAAIRLRSITDAAARTLMRRFSRFAARCVAVVALSGALQIWRQVGSVDALTTTTYGRTLIVKLLAVAVMLAIGAFLRRRLARSRAHSMGPGVLRALSAEATVGLFALAVTSALVATAPARATVARPAAATIVTASVAIDLTVNPARRSVNRIDLYLFDPRGGPRIVNDVDATARNSGTNASPIVVPLRRVTDSHWSAARVVLPFPGTWTINVQIRTTPFDIEEGETTITIR